MNKIVNFKDARYYLSEKVLDANFRGWLKVKVIDLGERLLCFGTTVSIISRNKNTEIIEILEGPYRDFIAVATIESSRFDFRESYFKKVDENIKVRTAKVIFDSKRELLHIEGLGIFKAVLGDVNITKGVYMLQIPSHPHLKTPFSFLRESLGGSKFAETWFRIVPINGVSASFLHFGQLSEGCIVVNELNSWSIIYNYLIRCRHGRLNIGIIKVI